METHDLYVPFFVLPGATRLTQNSGQYTRTEEDGNAIVCPPAGTVLIIANTRMRLETGGVPIPYNETMACQISAIPPWLDAAKHHGNGYEAPCFTAGYGWDFMTRPAGLDVVFDWEWYVLPVPLRADPRGLYVDFGAWDLDAKAAGRRILWAGTTPNPIRRKIAVAAEVTERTEVEVAFFNMGLQVAANVVEAEILSNELWWSHERRADQLLPRILRDIKRKFHPVL